MPFLNTVYTFSSEIIKLSHLLCSLISRVLMYPHLLSYYEHYVLYIQSSTFIRSLKHLVHFWYICTCVYMCVCKASHHPEVNIIHIYIDVYDCQHENIHRFLNFSGSNLKIFSVKHFFFFILSVLSEFSIHWIFSTWKTL